MSPRLSNSGSLPSACNRSRGSYCQGSKADDTASVRDTNNVESVKRRIGHGSGTVSNLRCVCRYLSASSTLEDWNEKLTQSEA